MYIYRHLLYISEAPPPPPKKKNPCYDLHNDILEQEGGAE